MRTNKLHARLFTAPKDGTLAGSRFLMAFNMSVGMTVWMRFRGHAWRSVLEMDGAMFQPLITLIPLLWLDAISADVMFGLARVLMLPTTLAVMLRRRYKYGHALAR